MIITNKSRLLTIFIITLLSFQTFGQVTPKREFRGVWVATVTNIDFPSSANLDSESQRKEWTNMLDKLKAMGMNAVVAQIRPAGDAFYPSDYAPWSKYLTGKQGQAPVPFYDPLEFMIAESHKRGMEFHAWLNPYRATMDLKTQNLSSKHILKQHPDWFIEYGGRYYFNPGLKEVRSHINDIVQEIVEKYNIDAIHFDDYFYPYKSKGKEFPDDATFQEFGKEFEDKGDWRRHNVDLLIEELSTTIRLTKPWVRFGISPFGVWRNKSQDAERGSNSRASIASYDDLHADVLKWMEEGWIDYIVPQLYWYIGLPVADYDILIDWWNDNTYDKHLYIGHAAYKVGDGGRQKEWQNPKEMANQIRLNRVTPNAKGSIYFSARSFKPNKLGLVDTITYHYRYPALIPSYDKVYIEPHNYPRQYRAKNKDEAVRLRWKYSKKDLANPPFYYVIYRFKGKEVGDFKDASNILAVTAFDELRRSWEYFDETAKSGQQYTYVIRPVNKMHQEGLPSRKRTVKKK